MRIRVEYSLTILGKTIHSFARHCTFRYGMFFAARPIRSSILPEILAKAWKL